MMPPSVPHLSILHAERMLAEDLGCQLHGLATLMILRKLRRVRIVQEPRFRASLSNRSIASSPAARGFEEANLGCFRAGAVNVQINRG